MVIAAGRCGVRASKLGKMMGKQKIARSSITGRFVRKSYARTHKRTTEIQRVKKVRLVPPPQRTLRRPMHAVAQRARGQSSLCQNTNVL